MFKTLTITAALLALSLSASATELNNDSEIDSCLTAECMLIDAGISFIGRVTDVETSEVLILILADMADRSLACSLVSEDEILFLTGKGTFEGC